MRPLALRFAAITAATSAIAVGCGPGAAAQRVRAHAASPVGHIACSQAVHYGSLAQLRRAATSIAMLRPTGVAAVRPVGGLPFTIATARVLKTLAGQPLLSGIQLRQMGSAKVSPGEGCAPLVSRGHIYLAYLGPFQLRPKGPRVHDQYVVVGGPQGLFEGVGEAVPADPSTRSFTRVDPSSASTIPPRVSIQELVGS